MNARKIISSAFYELLQRYTIEEISVNMIVESAEVSKPTFYRYYRDKYDLLGSIYDIIFQPMRDAGNTLSWENAMLQVLTNLENNIKFMQNGLKSNDLHSLGNYNEHCISDALTNMLSIKGVDTSREDIMFSVRSCAISHTAAIIGWVCDEKRMSKEHFAMLLSASLPHNLYDYVT